MVNKAQLLITFLLLCWLVKVNAMGFLSEKVCLFTGFEARLTYQGEPVSNANVVFINEYGEKTTETETTTNSLGEVKFETIYGKRSKYSLAEFVSRQTILVFYKGGEIAIWTGGKLNPEMYIEFGGVPSNINCELTEARRTINLYGGGFIGTNCHWRVARAE